MSEGFRLVVLGCYGGPREDNLSCYLVYPPSKIEQAFSFDGGSILAGLTKASEKGNLSDFKLKDPSLKLELQVLRHHIKAYLISHAHLDHIAGLVINSQSDIAGKYLVGSDKTINDIVDNIYNSVIWPNFGNEGAEPQIELYKYQRLPFFKKLPLASLPYEVEAFPLSHPGHYSCTAFLVRHDEDYILYFGDTSADSREKEKHIQTIWKRIAPLVEEKKLRAIFLECSVPNEDSEQVKYGHLCPELFMEEFDELAKLCKVPLTDFKVIVTHRKETLETEINKPHQIQKDLIEINNLGLDLIFPTQGERYHL
jgi:cAMP phosphodiesterase